MRLASSCSLLRATLAAVLLCSLPACPSSTDHDAVPRIRIDAERYRVSLFDDDYALGGETPLVTVVVFTDYACPPCASTWTVLEHLAEHYGQDIRIVFRSYTVPGFGKGEQAVEAAFAAGEQGKFWEMHRQLFAHQNAFGRPTMRAHAQALGLDVPRFMDDLDTGAQAARRMRHRRQARQLGVIGLPAMFVNGLYMAGFAEESTWLGIVNEEISRAQQLIAAGTPRAELYAKLMSSASSKRVTAPKGADVLKDKLAKKQAEAAAPKQLVAPDTTKRYQIEHGASPASGPPDAAVEIVEFLDFQCPYCRRAWQEELEALTKEHPGEVSVVIVHLPLEIHTSALAAARASLAAARQQKFWQFHTKMIATRGELGRKSFLGWAQELGLDPEQFGKDLDDPETAKQIQQDMALADRLGVGATPGFFVNGRFVNGFRPGQLRGMVKEELEAAAKLKAEGVKAGDVRARLMDGAVGPEGYPNP